MQLSVSSYSFAQYIAAGKMTLFDAIEKASALGFPAIEFTDLPGEGQNERLALAKRLKEFAGSLGVAISAYSVGGCLYNGDAEKDETEVKRLCDQVDIAAALGASVMRHDVVYTLGKVGAARSFDLMLPTIAANARKITEYAACRGIRTCTENHGYIAQDSDRLERLFCAVGHDNYGLLVDVGNFVCVDEDNANAVSRLAPYAIYVHMKDMHISDEPGDGYIPTRGGRFFKGAVLGEGQVDIPRCLRILKQAGYDGYLSLEFEGSEDCIDGISRGKAFLDALLETL